MNVTNLMIAANILWQSDEVVWGLAGWFNMTLTNKINEIYNGNMNNYNFVALLKWNIKVVFFDTGRSRYCPGENDSWLPQMIVILKMKKFKLPFLLCF